MGSAIYFRRYRETYDDVHKKMSNANSRFQIIILVTCLLKFLIDICCLLQLPDSLILPFILTVFIDICCPFHISPLHPFNICAFFNRLIYHHHTNDSRRIRSQQRFIFLAFHHFSIHSSGRFHLAFFAFGGLQKTNLTKNFTERR